MNRVHFLFIYIFAIFFHGACQEKPEFDVAIVGGGLAGLAAASELSDLRIILLEKNNRLGGRVQTLQRSGINFETGALFAYDPRILRRGFTSSEFLAGADKMALHYDGRNFACRHAADCLNHAISSKDEIQSAARWLEDDSVAHNELRPRAYEILNGFFRAIHPGQLVDYWIKGRKQLFAKIPNGRYAGGNKELADFLLSRVEKGAIRTGFEVSGIDDQGEVVEVRLSGEHSAQSIFVRKVICATDGETAKRLVIRQKAATGAWLNKLTYKGGVSINLALARNPFPGIGYIVNATENFHVFFISPERHSAQTVLTGYRASSESDQLLRDDSNSVVKEAVRALKTYGVNLRPRDLLFSHAQVWEKIGVITTKNAYAEWNEIVLTPSENVYLAGDYTFVDSNIPMPYGISAAVLSGYRAADSVRRQLGKL